MSFTINLCYADYSVSFKKCEQIYTQFLLAKKRFFYQWFIDLCYGWLFDQTGLKTLP